MKESEEERRDGQALRHRHRRHETWLGFNFILKYVRDFERSTTGRGHIGVCMPPNDAQHSALRSLAYGSTGAVQAQYYCTCSRGLLVLVWFFRMASGVHLGMNLHRRCENPTLTKLTAQHATTLSKRSALEYWYQVLEHRV